MYPLDFEEFCTANGVSENILYALKDCFLKQIPVDPLVHDKTAELFKPYIIAGGMPAAVPVSEKPDLPPWTDEKDVNFGAVYENAAAQELKAHDFDLYYFNSKKTGRS